jgi:hypothetical protein
MKKTDIKRVFILGAGASKHCGYPLTNDILREVTKKASDEHKFHIHNFIKHQYPNFIASYRNYPNIEDVLSLLDVSIRMKSEVPDSQYNLYTTDVSEIRRIILRNIVQYFFQILNDVDSNMPIYKFADCLTKKDVVISFNWDLNLEKALKDLKKKYSYDLNAKNKITILKPHGSINWYQLKEINLKERKRTPLYDGINDEEDERLHVFRYFRSPKSEVNKDFIPYIVPPTINKAIDIPEIRKIWRDIFQSLSYVPQINVLGYSLPNFDLNSRYIIRTAIRENKHFRFEIHYNLDRSTENLNQVGTEGREARQFLIANPDDSTYLTYRNLAGDPLTFLHARFEDLNFEELFK